MGKHINNNNKCTIIKLIVVHVKLSVSGMLNSSDAHEDMSHTSGTSSPNL